MRGVCLAFLRFCLSAWVGIDVFFVMVILGLRHSELFDRMSKFNHPKVLFPLYYSFEFALLGTALVCAIAVLWSPASGKVRRYALLACVAAACGLALVDYTIVYRKLVDILADPTAVPAAQFVERHTASRRLNEAILGVSVIAAILALWPESSHSAEAREKQVRASD